MRKHLFVFVIFVAALAAGLVGCVHKSETQPERLTVKIWPHGAPGEGPATAPERDITKPGDALVAGRKVVRLTGVSDPAITLYLPAESKNTGAMVVVFPGGGYQILAMDLEGTEVCHWLTSIGVTCALLKYRVPPPKGLPRYAAPLQDAQRAVGLVRDHAREWRVDPHRIGVLGFSAGGDLAAILSTNFEKRTYAPVDNADRMSSRPDFAMLIYPAYLVNKRQDDTLALELNVTANTPPTFLVQAEDDPVGVENSIFYYLALKKETVPAEMHLYPAGGHGYGLRRTKAAVTTWPERAEDWMRSLGVLPARDKL